MSGNSQQDEAELDFGTEDFEDACDTQPDLDFTEWPEQQVDIETALEEAQQAIDYFFNNEFEAARNLMKPRARYSMYHSLGNSVFCFLEAVLTFEQKYIAEAAEALKICLAVCSRYRKKNTIAQTIGKMVRKPDYDTYSEMEVHAELCYAESLLLRALLTFMEDETLSSFIRGGMKIRTCFNSYKECKIILDSRDWKESKTKKHFESGVCVGVGAFNLMISMLPSRIIKLLEFIGFSGDKSRGLRYLEAGYEMHDGIRQILCVMTLLAYHLIIVFLLTDLDGNIDKAENILSVQLKKYPNGVWFLFFKGRLEFLKGNLDSAIEWYKKSWHSQDIWPQFHHICFWEMIWVHSMKLEWKEASMYANLLLESSRWSKTIYSYQKAAILYMLDENLSVSERGTVEFLMSDAPKHKQRIAGKSLPMEKFIIKKCERYFEQNKSLVLPAIELMFLWNNFKILRKNFVLANNLYKLIEKTHVQLNASSDKSKYDSDNKALVLLLKGACLRQMKSPLQALECLETVVSLQKDIKEDTYIVPYAIVEIGLLAIEQGEKEKATLALEDAKKRYSGYCLESRLHFRIHTALSDIKGNVAD